MYNLGQSPYHSRIERLLDKAEIGYFVRSRLRPTIEYMPYLALSDFLSGKAETAYKGRVYDQAERIVAAGSSMGDMLINQAVKPLDFRCGASICAALKRVELRQSDFTSEELEGIRHQLSRSAAIIDLVKDNESSLWNIYTNVNLAVCIGIIFLIFFLPMFFFWLCMFILSLRKPHVVVKKTGILSHILFLGSLLGFVGLTILFSYTPTTPILLESDGNVVQNLLPYGLIISAALWTIFWILSFLPSHDKVRILQGASTKTVFCLAVWFASLVTCAIGKFQDPSGVVWPYMLILTGASLILWVLLMFGPWMISWIPFLWFMRNRVIQLLLVVTFFSSVYVSFGR